SVPINPYPNIIASQSFVQRLSRECGGKRFQVVKLQRAARTTVSSHPAKGMPATFHRIRHDHDEIQNECLSCCEHPRMASPSIVKARGENHELSKCSVVSNIDFDG